MPPWSISGRSTTYSPWLMARRANTASCAGAGVLTVEYTVEDFRLLTKNGNDTMTELARSALT